MILNSEKQQINTIQNQAVRRLSVIDLNINGNDVTNEEVFIKAGWQAVKNKIIFWLNFLPGDVVRSQVASPLQYLIGKTVTDENRSSLENFFRKSFEDQFTEDKIKLNSVTISMDIFKIINISMIVIDNITNSLIPIELEVAQ